MALRRLARGMWDPVACTLRRRSGDAMPAAEHARFLGTIRNQAKQHSNGTPKETAEEKAFVSRELDKVCEALRQRDKDLEKLKGEAQRVGKIYAVSVVVISTISLFWRWKHPEATQEVVQQGTSH